MTNAELQAKISTLTTELFQLEHDPSYVQNKQQMAAVYNAAPNTNQPWSGTGCGSKGKESCFCWVDSNGQYWCDAQSNAIFLGVRQAIAAQDLKIAAKKGDLKTLQTQLSNSPETISQSAAANTLAQVKKYKWIFAIVVVVIIAISIFAYLKWGK